MRYVMLSPTTILILAIFMQLFATSLNYIGMTIQKKAANSLPAIGSEAGLLASVKNFGGSKGWLFGYAINLISAFLSTAALSLAAISLIQPLYGFGLIVLVIFSRFYLKEEITRIDVFGVCLGILGVIVIGILAKPQDGLFYVDLISLYGAAKLVFQN